MRKLLSVLVLCSCVPACMFFRNLDDLNQGVADGGPRSESDASEHADAPDAPDVGADARRPGCQGQRGSSSPAGVDVCFDYDEPDAGAEFYATQGGTLRPEPDDGPSPPNALVMRAPPMTYPVFGSNRQYVDVPLKAKKFRVSFSFRMDVVADSVAAVNFVGFVRDDVNLYLIYSVVDHKLYLAEQDQRDGGLVNNSTPHSAAVVDLSTWHTVDLAFDFVAQKATLQLDGTKDVMRDEPLQMTNVDAPGHVWIGSEFITDNTAPLVYHYDDVRVTASP